VLLHFLVLGVGERTLLREEAEIVEIDLAVVVRDRGELEALALSALDYVQKPVDPIVLAAYLHRALQERQFEKPDLAFKDLIEILSAMVANTIERVDPYTAGHGSRTRKYCRFLAEKLGLPRERTEHLELAAIAHDYGKIYLDDLGFLTKKGPLTDEEFKAVQRHPQLGARKLGHHPQLAAVRRFVAQVAERSGWPEARVHDVLYRHDASDDAELTGAVRRLDELVAAVVRQGPAGTEPRGGTP